MLQAFKESGGVAKYGLGQLDLNLLAQLSLAGLIERPETHISNLLRSQQPIEQATRQALDDALSGRLTGSRLKITQTKPSDFVRRFRRLQLQIRIGQQVPARMASDGLTYDQAVEAVARDCPYSEDSVERFYTLANRLEAWLEQCRKLRTDHSYTALEMAFIYSTLHRLPPKEGLKLSVEHLSEIILLFEVMVADASGKSEIV